MAAEEADGGGTDTAPGCGAPPLQPLRTAPGHATPVVAFDFDGTLTVRDSFNAFLLWRTSPWRLAWGAVWLVGPGLRYLVDRDRGAIKAAAVRALLRGVARSRLTREAEAFAQAHADRLLRPDAVAAFARHRREGDVTVIVTASPDLVVAPFARRLGADRLIGTRLVFDADDRAVGALDGANCRGAEKVVQLREAFGADLRLKAAYGDTSGDREMLALADQPGMRVFCGRP